MNIVVRPLREDDLADADRIMRLAFGTFLGLPDPLTFLGDAGFVRSRWQTDPAAAFAAEVDGRLVGSNFATNWGSVGFLGPITVHPDVWDGGVGRRLIEPVMEVFDAWGIRQAGLFTFPSSTKHIGLYQRFGFYPRFLTPILSKSPADQQHKGQWSCFSSVPEQEREACLRACFDLTSSIYDGLDVRGEISAVDRLGLGDTILLRDAQGTRLTGLAVAHCGPNTEAGSGTCFLKFAAARPGADAATSFERLMDACEAFAARRGLTRITAGVNTAREEAYRQLLARGFRAGVIGIAMHRDNDPGYNRPGVYVVDDWR